MPYKKDGQDVIEYRVREDAVNRFTVADFNELITTTDTQVTNFDVVKLGTLAYDAKVAKLAELNVAKTAMEV